jgi:uncharacterized protein YdeI (YjbR/CyaY-like superfamily)
MEITEVFYPTHRGEWRAWLEAHHRTKTEVWIQTYTKASGMPCCIYDEVVEEALCFGWIDGSVRKYDALSMVQRITPRRKRSQLSELNRQRVWKLQANGLMTPAGIAPIENQIGSPDDPLEVPEWIIAEFQEAPEAWANFQAFPLMYRRLKIGWITDPALKTRRPEAQKRLAYLIKMSAKGKMYGTRPL